MALTVRKKKIIHYREHCMTNSHVFISAKLDNI